MGDKSTQASSDGPTGLAAATVAVDSAEVDLRELRLFEALDLNRNGRVQTAEIYRMLEASVLRRDDARLRKCIEAIERSPSGLDFDAFCQAVRPDILLVERAAQGNSVIPDFQHFSDDITESFETTMAMSLTTRTGPTVIPNFGPTF